MNNEERTTENEEWEAVHSSFSVVRFSFFIPVCTPQVVHAPGSPAAIGGGALIRS
jgi:hypothetical protein